MSNNGNTKKRKIEGGARVSIDGAGINGENSSAELSAIKSMMQELVQQNRTQTNMMQSMQAEITQLTKKCTTMETTINSRFDEVNDKLKYHDILLQNQKWKYSAPRPSSVSESGEAEKFLKQIKKCTEKMRYGQGNGEIVITADIPYNEAYLPHWKEFANALEQYHHFQKYSTELRDNSKLFLRGMIIPDEVTDLLSKAIKSTHFQSIDLRGNNFGQKGICFVSDYLESNPNLKALCLHSSPINKMDDINKLCKSIKQHPSINHLDFNKCAGAGIDGYEMLKMIMDAGKNKLEDIDLSNNNISTWGTYISDFLASKTVLDSLDLFGNKLNDRDAVAIAKALKHNKRLSFLDLTGNNITKRGWVALRKIEFDDTSLNTAANSNHTCNIKYPTGRRLIGGVDIREMNGDKKFTIAFAWKFVRQKKIYSVLSKRNRDCSNVKHFDEVPVELLPNMLHSIHKYSNYSTSVLEMSQDRGHVQPLSIVYEVCRHWEDSLAAFEALSS